MVSEQFQGSVRERAEAGRIELEATMLGFVHSQRALEPEVRGVGEVDLEGGGGD